MSALTAYKNLTLAEVNKREGYDDMAAVVGELAKVNDIVDEFPWYPSTHGAYNRQLQAKRLGAGAFSQVNGAVNVISSETDYITEPVKLYEGDSQIDTRALASADDPYQVRDSEDALNLAGFLQDWVYNLFYAAATTQDALKSFNQRRSALGSYCVGAGGSGGDTTSLWTFELGPNGIFFAYNKSGSPGIKSEDMGKVLVSIPNGTGSMWAWVRHYELWAAIVLRNERAMIRYTNIESSGSSNIFSPSDYIKKVKNQLPNAGRNAVSFANRTLKGQIDADAYSKSNAAYSVRDIADFGPVTLISGIPVRMCEALLDTETVVS